MPSPFRFPSQVVCQKLAFLSRTVEMPRSSSLDSQLRPISSDLDGKEFVPLDALEKAITKPNVASELSRTNSFLARILPSIARPDVSSRITAQARKVFAILVLLDRATAIQGLLDEGLTDEHLPLSRSPDHEALVSWDGVEFPFTGWKPASVNLFVKQQWPFLAPILDTTGRLINVNQESPLPFTKTDIIGSGAAGVVYQATVHPAQQRGFEAETARLQVAVKQFHRMDDFTTEDKILQQIKTLKDRHIIRHLVSIERGKKGYIVFPWADRGNLQEFWEATEPETTWECALWSMKQMLGLAKALHLLHASFQCRHGDLKPINILCITDGGKPVLKIADFGISRIHDAPTMYRKSATTSLFLTPSYQAPEVEFEDADKKNPQPRSRRYDIWSLGCVFLEFSIWLLHGPKAIEGFARTRGRYGTSSTNSSVPLYEVTDKAAKVAIVHQLVSWTIERLQNDTRCKGDTALATLLSLIKDQMLQPKVEDRAWAEGVGKQLEEIVRKAENHEPYLFHSCDGLSIPLLNFDEFQSTMNS